MGPFDQDPNEPLDQQEQQFTPPVPTSYTQADDLTRQRLEAGLSSVQDDIDDGNLHPDYGQPIIDKISQRLAPLYQKRQAAKAQAMQEQHMELLHANAQQQALVQTDAANDALNFEHRTSRLVDPLTGRAAHFYQTEPGKWSQVDFGEPSPVTGAEGMGAEDLPSEDNPQSFASGQPQVQQNPDGTQQMTVWNGQFRTEATFGPDKRLIGQQTFDPMGRPMPQQLAVDAQHFGVPEGVLAQISAKAQRLFPGSNIHSQKGQRDYILQETGLWRQQKLASDRAQAQIAQETRKQEAEQQKKQEAEQAKAVEKWQTTFGKHLNSMRTESKKAVPQGEERPAYLASEEKMVGEAYRRTAAERGDYPGIETQQAGPAEAKPAPVARESPKAKPLPVSREYRDTVRQKLIAAGINPDSPTFEPLKRPMPGPDPNPSTGFRTIQKF